MSIQDSILKKAVKSEEAVRIVDGWRLDGLRIVFTNGCFDILHYGHLFVLTSAAGQGDKLVVGLNSDQSVKRLKGTGRPVNDEFHRSLMLAAMVPVDLVTVFEEDTPLELIRALRPHVLVKGGDYEEGRIAGAAEVRAAGGRVVIVPYQQGFGTTRLLNEK